MLISFKDQIELTYEFNKKLYDDDVDDIDEIVDIIIELRKKYNNKYLKLSNDDILLNIDIYEILNKYIDYKTNLLYKVLTYKDNTIINYESLYDPLKYYHDDIKFDEIIDLIIGSSIKINNYDILIIKDKTYYKFYLFNDENEIELYYDKYELLKFYIDHKNEIINELIDDIEIELNKTYNMLKY